MGKRTGIMLCYPMEEKRLAKWTPPYIVQPKYNGERCRAILDENGHPTLISSEGNVILSVPHIEDALKRSGLRNIELDGELYTHGFSFELIHSIVSRKVNLHDRFEDLQYHVFDIISTEYQLKRIATLCNLPWNKGPYIDPIRISPFVLCNSFDSVMRVFADYCREQYEGIIIRNADGIYRRDWHKEVRSTQVLKFKPKKSDYYTIAGFSAEIDKYGILKPGLLGRFICLSQTTDSLPFLYEYPPRIAPPYGYFAVGARTFGNDKEADIRDRQREHWKKRMELVGNLLHVEYQHTTPGRGVPRFPVYKEILWTRTSK